MDRQGCRFLINFGQGRKFSLGQMGPQEKSRKYKDWKSAKITD